MMALATAGVQSGCYSYALVRPDAATVGQNVRARVSGAEAERLEPVLGITGREIEGELLQQGDSSVVLAVMMPFATVGGAAPERVHQRIVIPRAELQELQVRQLDRSRTTLAIGAAVVVVGVAIAASTGAIELGSGGSRGNPNETRIPASVALPLPLFRIPIGHVPVLPPP
jgi:hypothetical protein